MGRRYNVQGNEARRWTSSGCRVHKKWLVLVCACSLMAVQGGFCFAFNVLFVDLLEEYGESRARTAAIQSVYTAVNLISGFYAGFLVDRYGPKKCGVLGCFMTAAAITSCYFAKSTTLLIISYGVIAAVFTIFFLFSGMKAVLLTFSGSTKLLALSLFYACTPIGGAIYPYFLRYLCDNYGVPKTFLISGLFSSLCIIFALGLSIPEHTVNTMYKDDKTKSNECQSSPYNSHLAATDYEDSKCSQVVLSENQEKTEIRSQKWTKTLQVIFRNVPFILFAVGQSLSVSSFRVLSVFITDILREKEFSLTEATLAYTVFSFSVIPGRLLPGLVSKLPVGGPSNCVVLVTFLSAPAIIGFKLVTGHELAVLACALCGLAFGVAYSSNAICITGLVSAQYQTPAVGISSGLTGVVVAVTGPLSDHARIPESFASGGPTLSTFRWRADDGPTLNAGLVFQRFWTSIAKRRWTSSSCRVNRKWLVLVCACSLMAVQGGFCFAFNVLFVDLLEEYGESRARTAAIQSVYTAVNLISGFYAGFLVDRYGPKKCGVIGCFMTAAAITSCYFAKSTTLLIISYGVIAAIFTIFFLFSGMKAVLLTFSGSTKLLALSLFYACTPTGGAIYPYFLRYLCDNYGVPKTFLISGLFSNVCIIFALGLSVPEQTVNTMFKDDKTKSNKCQSSLKNSNLAATDCEDSKCSQVVLSENQEKTEIRSQKWTKTLQVIFRNVPFILFAVGQSLSVSSFRVLSVFITDILREKEFSSTEATLAYTVFSFSVIPGRLLPGLVSKLPVGGPSSCVVLVTFLSAPAIIGLKLVTGHELAVLVCALCGLAFGVAYSSNAVCITGLVSAQYQTPAVGISSGLTGVVVAITGPLSGSVRDSSTSYTGILIGIAIAVLSASVIFFFSFLLKRKPTDKGHFVGDIQDLHVPPITSGDFSQNNDVKVYIVSTKL